MVNLVILVGRVGQNPELKVLDEDRHVCSLSVATSRRYKDNQGEWQEQTEWHSCSAWGKTADYVSKYIGKGDQVYIEGTLHYSKRDIGGGKSHTYTNVTINRIHRLGPKRDDQPQPAASRTRPQPAPRPAEESLDNYDGDPLDDYANGEYAEGTGGDTGDKGMGF